MLVGPHRLANNWILAVQASWRDPFRPLAENTIIWPNELGLFWSQRLEQYYYY